jgi:lambda repressor-like predicted transcriptional regulator
MAKERKTLSEAILEKLDELGSNKDTESIRLGLSSNTLSRWSTSSSKWSRPGPQNAKILMDFLGVSLEELATLILVDELERNGFPIPK